MSRDLTLPALFARHVAERPHEPALIDGERTVTWREFDGLCRASADWLAAQGVGRGDRVAIWLVNRVEWLALLFGLARIGAAAVACNTRYRSSELDYLLERSGARLLVLQLDFGKIDIPAVLAGVRPEAAATVERVAVVAAGERMPATILGKPTLRFDASGPTSTSATSGAPAAAPSQADPDALMALFTTSGTTKGPKLVMHPQRTLALHAQRVARAYRFDEPGARLLLGLPLCGVYGFNAALGAMTGGAPVVMMDVFDEAGAVALMQSHAITHLFGSDEMLKRMFELVPRERPFPAARVFGYAAFRSDALEVGRDAWARGVPLHGLYGSSEVQALFAMQPASLPLEERLQPGGRPVSGAEAEVRIRDLDTREPLAVGQTGEIEIRSPTSFVGYFNDPEATAAAIGPDGFFRTGDIGHLRDDGTFVYEARGGDAMRLGGHLVSPFEVEAVLRQLPGVAEAQVVPVEIAGQRRCAAFVMAAAGAQPTAEALIAQAAPLMASFKVPVRVWFVDSFPTTESANGSKIQRAKLRTMAAERLRLEAGDPGGAGA